MNMENILLISFAVLLGSFIQGTSGMGFALIVVPVVSLLSPQFLPVLILLLMLPLNIYVAVREWKFINKSGILWISLGRFIGTFGGIALLTILSLKNLSLLVGLSTILATLLTWIAPKFNPNTKIYIGAGLITGITETTTGIGGPPLALTYQHRPAAEMRATIAVCFLFGEIVSLIFLLVLGSIDKEILHPTIWLIFPLLLGMGFSHFSHKKLNQYYLRKFVQIFSLCSGILLIIKCMY